MQRVLHMAPSAEGGRPFEPSASGGDAGRVSGGGRSPQRQHQPAPLRARPDRQECPVAQNKTKAESVVPTAAVGVEDEIAYLAKRHRVSPAIVREIMRRSGASERAAIEREIQKGKARR